jgi:preprotein translocase subunit YajC
MDELGVPILICILLIVYIFFVFRGVSARAKEREEAIERGEKLHITQKIAMIYIVIYGVLWDDTATLFPSADVSSNILLNILLFLSFLLLFSFFVSQRYSNKK